MKLGINQKGLAEFGSLRQNYFGKYSFVFQEECDLQIEKFSL